MFDFIPFTDQDAKRIIDSLFGNTAEQAVSIDWEKVLQEAQNG